MESIVNVLGKNFTGTLIEDPVIEPYFITCESGSYAVSRKRFDKSGKLRYSDICYPSSFESCLTRIAKEKMTDNNEAFSSIQDYINAWKQITNNIFTAVKAAGIKEL